MRDLKKIEKDILRRIVDAKTHGNTDLEEILFLARERVDELKLVWIPKEGQ